MEQYRINMYNESLVKSLNIEMKKHKCRLRFSIDDLMDVYEKMSGSIRVVIRRDKKTNLYFAVIFNYDIQSITLISYYCTFRNITPSLEVFEDLDIAIFTSKYDTADKVKEVLKPWLEDQ